MKKLLLCLPVFTLLLSCSNDSKDDLKSTENIPTESTITYEGTIKKIVTENCISCHGSFAPSGGLSLTNYSQVKDAIKNNGLLDRINKPEGDPLLMPEKNKLTNEQLESFSKWNNNGLLEK